MTTPVEGTLVVSRDHIEELDHKLFRLSLLASSAETRRIYEAQRGVLAALLREGTTVPLDHLTVVELATPVRETPWQRQERDQERYYSEADYADADLSPAGGAA